MGRPVAGVPRRTVVGANRRRLALALFAGWVAALATVVAPWITAEPAGGAQGANWTVYHASPSGAGDAPPGLRLSDAKPAWTSPDLGGQLYGEPLVATGRVFVATERDTVDALTARTGRVVWSKDLGTPVPATALPCGDISPTVGITGTPVIDPSRHEIFVVADVLSAGRPSHRLVGLALSNGRTVLSVDVDPPGADPAAILQRTGLALNRGSVVFGFGGNDGDCGTYHGWVVSVSVGGRHHRIHRYEADAGSGDRQGAVWMGGAAPEVGAGGDLWVAEGNGSVVSAGHYDGSDSVVELNPVLRRVASFSPPTWYDDNARDLDLGSTAPALVGSASVVQVGKSGKAYLLDRRRLGGVGGQRETVAVCDGSTADGGDAVAGDVVYVPCRSGVEAVETGTATLTVLWRARTAPFGPPIVAAGLVWSVGATALLGLSPTDGATVERLTIGSNANHFPTPSVGDGRLFVTGGTAGDEVLAFAGS